MSVIKEQMLDVENLLWDAVEFGIEDEYQLRDYVLSKIPNVIPGVLDYVVGQIVSFIHDNQGSFDDPHHHLTSDGHTIH